MTNSTQKEPQFLENDTELNFDLPEMTDGSDIGLTRSDGAEVLKAVEESTPTPVEKNQKFMTLKKLHEEMQEGESG